MRIGGIFVIDRKNVVQRLEEIHAVAVSRDQLYINHMGMADFNSLLNDTISLLKDRKPVITTNYGKKFYKCANCGENFDLDFGKPRKVKVCRHCGQGVKWND